MKLEMRQASVKLASVAGRVFRRPAGQSLSTTLHGRSIGVLWSCDHEDASFRSDVLRDVLAPSFNAVDGQVVVGKKVLCVPLLRLSPVKHPLVNLQPGKARLLLS